MAEQVLTNAHVTINSVELSDHVRSLTCPQEAELVDITAMGDTYRTRLGGLKDWSVEVEFNQDYASNEVDATLNSILGSSVTVAWRPVNTTIAATNPEYTGSAILESYTPVGGGVGDADTARATFRGNGALTRSTS